MQVLPLHAQCRPLYLMIFSSSADEFAVICAGLSLHFAERHSNNTVSLEDWSGQCSNSGHSGVLLEVSSGQQHIAAVSYIDGETMEVCSVNSGTRSNPGLPQNIDCLATSNPTVHPIHTPDMFMLQCTTEDATEGRETLYVVSIPQTAAMSGDAHGIEAGGHPHSSPSGTYIAVVDSRRIVVYVTNNSSQELKSRGFSSKISQFEFLNDRTVLILTQIDDHILIDLKNASHFGKLPGPPITWTMADPSNNYIYVLRSDELYAIYIVNQTSTQPWYEVKDVANEPEMLIFLNKPPNPPADPPVRSDKGPNIGAIVGGSTAGLVSIVIVTVLVTVVAVKVYIHRHVPKPKPSQSPAPHCQEKNSNGAAFVHVLTTSNPYDGRVQGGDRDGGKSQLDVLQNVPSGRDSHSDQHSGINQYIPQGTPPPQATPPSVDQHSGINQYIPQGTPPPQATPPPVDQHSGINQYIPQGTPPPQATPPPGNHMYSTIDNYLPATTAPPNTTAPLNATPPISTPLPTAPPNALPTPTPPATPPPTIASSGPPVAFPEHQNGRELSAVYRTPIPFPTDNRSHPVDNSLSAEGYTVRAEQENPAHVHTTTEFASCYIFTSNY